jgi:hypothetical protein
MTTPLERADELYALASLLDEGAHPLASIGPAEMIGFLTDPDASLSDVHAEQLRSDLSARRRFQAFKRAAAFAELPRLAAAAGGEVDVRLFDGGQLRILRDELPGQTYLVFRWETDDLPDGPMLLIAEREGTAPQRIPLPQHDGFGELLVILDTQQPAAQLLLDLLSDPQASAIVTMQTVGGAP